jgi:HSP20 family protein
MDVVDREKEILVRAELPGVERKDINIELTGHMLTIEGEHRHEEKEEKGKFYRAEIREGRFSRQVHLPDEVEEKGVKAEFTNGVLEVHLPKLHKAERHKIEVK